MNIPTAVVNGARNGPKIGIILVNAPNAAPNAKQNANTEIKTTSILGVNEIDIGNGGSENSKNNETNDNNVYGTGATKEIKIVKT